MREMTPIYLFSVFSVPSVADFRSNVQGGVLVLSSWF
jgi:hypothetical protein